jgi:sulfide:quinone oxidoreductase
MAGTAGTMVVNKLRPRLPRAEWRSPSSTSRRRAPLPARLPVHPFGTYRPEDVVKPRPVHPRRRRARLGEVDRVDPEAAPSPSPTAGRSPTTSSSSPPAPRPGPTRPQGMLGPEWHKRPRLLHPRGRDRAARRKLASWEGGRLVVHITEMPIKCPVAPLEFAFLADAYFREARMRDQVELVYVTPLDGAFTKPVAAKPPRHMLEERGHPSRPTS